MDPKGTFAAKLLDSGLRAFAASAVLRERDSLRSDGTSLGPNAFEDLVRDAETHILYLGEALAAGRPALFASNVEWTRSSYAARGLSDERVERHLACLRAELASELPPGARESALAVVDGAASVFERPPAPIPSIVDGHGPHVQRIRELLLAVLEGRRDDALDLVLRAYEDGLSIDVLQSSILVPVQQEIGRMWQRGDVHVHEEHVCSQIIEEALVLLSGFSRTRPTLDKTVLVSSVQGNLHDIGARVVADHFQRAGWNTIRLGSSLPGDDLARAAHDFHGDLVALSVTMALHIRGTAAVIDTLRAQLGDATPPILVGGPPFELVPDLWEAVGANASAKDAPSAVVAGAELVGLAG